MSHYSPEKPSLHPLPMFPHVDSKILSLRGRHLLAFHRTAEPPILSDVLEDGSPGAVLDSVQEHEEDSSRDKRQQEVATEDSRHAL